MASTPEGKVKRAVKQLLNEHSAYHFWPVQMGYGSPCLDCVGCHEGRFFAIETKAPGKSLTKRQQATAYKMRNADAPVFIIDGSDTDDWNHLEAWLACRPTA